LLCVPALSRKAHSCTAGTAQPKASEIKTGKPVVLIVLTFYPESATVTDPEIFKTFLMRTPDLFRVLVLICSNIDQVFHKPDFSMYAGILERT
jgi:hypothetical protein